MANETLTIQQDKAKVTVIGKCKPDEFIDSGMGFDLDDLSIGELDPLDVDWDQYVDDDLPDEIRIITQPTKISYAAGEKLNLDGMVVGAYKNNSIWTNAKYPNGHIPLGELIVEPLVIKSGEDCFIYDNVVVYRTGDTLGIKINYYLGHYSKYVAGVKDATVVCWNPNGIPAYPSDDNLVYFSPQVLTGDVTVIASKNRTCQYCNVHESSDDLTPPDPQWYTKTLSLEFTKNNKTVYFDYAWGPFFGARGSALTIDADTSTAYNLYKYLAWEAIYGDSFQTIAVSWARPVDGALLSTSFSIDLAESSGNGGR